MPVFSIPTIFDSRMNFVHFSLCLIVSLASARVADIRDIAIEPVDELDVIDLEFDINCMARRIGWMVLVAFSITAIILASLGAYKSSSSLPH